MAARAGTAESSKLIRLKLTTTARIDGLLKDPRIILDAGYPNPQSANDVITWALDKATGGKA